MTGEAKPKQHQLHIVPITLDQANSLVSEWHRHHIPVQQHKFSIAVCKNNGVICGAAIVGRPVSRAFDDGMSLEVNRCVTDGTPNACSALYGAAARAAKALGYTRVFTYTRIDEPGASLRGAGWALDNGNLPAKSWNMPGRFRIDKTEVIGRKRWSWRREGVIVEPKFPAVADHKNKTVDMFASSELQT